MVGWGVNGCILWWTQGSQSTTGRRVADEGRRVQKVPARTSSGLHVRSCPLDGEVGKVVRFGG